MFQSPYRFHGTHSHKVDQLVGTIDPQNKTQIFKYVKEIYVTAPLVGYLYQRRAPLDDEKDPLTDKEYYTNIMAEQVISVSEDLSFNFSLIMLLDEEYTPNTEDRINKAFRFVGKDPADEERFDEYVRGGVDVLYEKLIEGDDDPTDYARRMYEFVDDITERYNRTLNLDEVMSLCVK